MLIVCSVTKIVSTFARVFFMVLDLRFVKALVRVPSLFFHHTTRNTIALSSFSLFGASDPITAIHISLEDAVQFRADELFAYR